MTMVKELIATLKNRSPNAQVFLMTTRKQPFENHLAGVVGREEMPDQQWRLEPGIAHDDVFLVVGKRIRPGSLSAWICAEHRAASEVPTVTPESTVGGARERMAATLADIARQHLRIDSLAEADEGWAQAHCLGTADLRAALEAAYGAGAETRTEAPADSSESLDEEDRELETDE